jgi:glycosyltransferase involved in cell wall biosynthesis
VKISVITPVFNGAQFIRQCVENVVNQKIDELEHIVVDGGSSDSTLEVLKEISAEYPHVQVLNGPDKGQSDAMNKGIKYSTGTVIGILNVDDEYQPNSIARALAIMQTQKIPTMVVGNCVVIDGQNKVTHTNKPTHLNFDDFLLGWKIRQFPINPSAYFYHRAVHDVVGYYDEDDHYSMDVDFLIRCSKRIKMIYVDELWGIFRLQPGGKTFDDLQNSEARLNALIKRYESDLNVSHRFLIGLKRLLSKDVKSGIRRRFERML